jgi:hypothetical protein
VGEKSETRRLEKEQKTRKKYPNAFYDFVLSEISCFRAFFSLVFVKVKSSPKGKVFFPIPEWDNQAQ